MKKIKNLFILFYFLAFAISSSAFADRLKDLTSIAGIRSNQLIGYGLVVGLAGTGDGNTQLIQQSMKSMVSQLGPNHRLHNVLSWYCSFQQTRGGGPVEVGMR